MKKIVFILTILVFQQNLYSQKEIVGKVEYYKSYNYGLPNIDFETEKTLESLNSRKQKVEVRQGTIIRELETDSSGIFKCNINPNEKTYFSINKKEKLTNGNFSFEPTELNDTLKLEISDLRIATYKDSIDSPDFYNKYSEKQAHSDFKNGKKRILANDEFDSKKSSERRKKLSKQYDFEYEYLFNSQTTTYKYRIMTRYNEIMKKLIGIKNVR